MNRKTILAAGAMSVCLTSASQAALSITDGDFNTGYPAAQASIDSWYSVTSGNFWENAFWDQPGVSPDSSPLVNLSAVAGSANPGDDTAGAWFYQGIGTSDGAETIQISFDFGTFDGAQPVNLRVALFEDVAGTFVQANDSDVQGVLGLVNAQTFSSTALAPAAPTTQLVTFDLSGVGAGNNLYLRFNNFAPSGGNTSYDFVDNVAIVPEPSIALLGGLGVLGLLRRRR